MGKNRFAALAVASLLGFTACGGGEEEAPDAVITDTVTQSGSATVQVPVTDTAIVQREISIDTTVQTDTVVREGQVTSPRPDTLRR